MEQNRWVFWQRLSFLPNMASWNWSKKKWPAAMSTLFLLPLILLITGCQPGRLASSSILRALNSGHRAEQLTAAAVDLFGENVHMNNQFSKPVAQEATYQGDVTPPPLNPIRPPTSPPTTSASAITMAESLIETGPLPKEIARVALLPDTGELIDFQLDRASGRIYVTDSSHQLHLLNANTFAPLSFIPDLPTTGNLFLDDVNHRLYIYPGAYSDQSFGTQHEDVVAIVDTEAWSLIGAVPGRYVSVDVENNRFFVGDPVYINTPADALGIRIYNGHNLFLMGEIPQPGIPVYNTLRDELLIVAYTVYAADPLTLQVITDLLPELSDQEPLWCNGCERAIQAHVFPDDNIVALELTTLSAGKGAGLYPEPRFFNAMTMRPIGKPRIGHSFVKYSLQHACGSHVTLRKPLDGAVYRDLTYSRYVVFNNLAVYDTVGKLRMWRDGLETTFVNPATGQAYADNGHAHLVLDLETLTPLGEMTPSCIFTIEDETGLIYAKNQHEFLVFAETGGLSQTPPTARSRPLPPRFVTDILPSPNYANDQTLFILIESREIYRSTDGGLHWVHLQGGLPPSSSDLVLDLAISPNYANDYTLFVGGARGNYWGEGVLRSVDGGETWQALWNRLTHLRVQRLVISPTYAEDGAILAYARYNRLDQWESGESVFLSEDRGEAWSLAGKKEMNDSSTLPEPEELLPLDNAQFALPVRIVDYGRELEFSLDDGQHWQRVDGVGHEDNYVKVILPSPTYVDDQTLYVLGEYDLWRSINGGKDWARWDDSRLVGRNYANALKTAAISPMLEDGSHRLFIGTAIGEFWTLAPDSLVWESIAVASLPSGEDGQMDAPVGDPDSETQQIMHSSTSSTPPPLPTEPPLSFYRPEGELAQFWERDLFLQHTLGWATELYPLRTAAAVQFFEGGLMIWRGDSHQIYVLISDGTWQVFEDTWRDDQPEFDPTMTPPPERLQPTRGFGAVWRNHPEIQEQLQWAIGAEVGNNMIVHPFKRGLIIRFGGVIHMLITLVDGGTVWY